jgi:hypothetical protein
VTQSSLHPRRAAGKSLAILDVTGDGKRELIIGVPGKYRSGMLTVFRGTADGIATDTAQLVHGYDGHGGANGGGFGSLLLN